MNPLVLIGIALGLSMDAFAVAVACSLRLRQVSFRQTFRLAFHFGLFQCLMPLIGWLAGRGAAQHLAHWDHWVAAVLLWGIGGKAIYEAFHGDTGGDTGGDAGEVKSDPTRGLSLILFSVATSIDALAVGLSLAMLQVRIVWAALVIGAITMAVTTCGVLLGKKIGERFSQKTEIVGGIVLIAIGLKILFSHIA